MSLKVRAFSNNEERLIPISDITGSVQRARDIFEISAIVGMSVTLGFVPLPLSETVVLNGLVMTEGANYDYVLTGKTITFNSGVLTQTGHVLINYSY